MRVVTRYTEGPETCMYLPDREATLTYEVVSRLTPQEYEDRMNQGWRKFGGYLFQPVCAACAECRPIRVPLARFVPDRSQRRALQHNQDLTVRCAPPTVDAARLDLWRRYHAGQALRKGWPASHSSALDYALHFVHNPVPGLELSIWEGPTLRAIVLTDVTPNVVSGVYHYHDPECRERSLGTFAILQTLELARQLGKSHTYLGFYVAGCGSMAYKARFRPCEILGTDGVWRDAPAAATAG